MEDWPSVYRDIEQLLFPAFSADQHERCAYYYLLSETRLLGKESATIPLSVIAKHLPFHESTVRNALRSLSRKGLLSLEQTRKGHFVKVILPSELGLARQVTSSNPIDIEAIDFFNDRTHRNSILVRENGRCFYCLKRLDVETMELDHVQPQQAGGNNSYRNIVASCHRCNTRKQSSNAATYIRTLYRDGLLSDEELADRLSTLDLVQSGELIPSINEIRSSDLT